MIWGPQANIGMGPYTFAHIYQINLEDIFFVVMLAAAQWCPIVVFNVSKFFMYIYIYAFSRRFYPKQLTLHSSYSFYILSALAFPGNRTHDLGVANAMLYQLSYRKAV